MWATLATWSCSSEPRQGGDDGGDAGTAVDVRIDTFGDRVADSTITGDDSDTGDSSRDAAMEAGNDSGADAGIEAGNDADAGDLGPDAEIEAGNDVDAGCTCTPVGSFGETSLACICGNSCPTYDRVLDGCRTSPAWHSHRLVEYADCNLIELRTEFGGLGSETFVYDATTHVIVGRSFISDVSSQCGSQMVFAHRGGQFPGASCTVSRDFDYCAPDGGDAATNDVDAALDDATSDGSDTGLGDATSDGSDAGFGDASDAGEGG